MCRLRAALLVVVSIVFVLPTTAHGFAFAYAYVPPLELVLNHERVNQEQAFDVWGRSVAHWESATLKKEDAVDRALRKWPAGTCDALLDQENNPTQFTNIFTLGDYLSSWTGFGAAGPFKGLTTLTNNLVE